VRSAAPQGAPGPASRAAQLWHDGPVWAASGEAVAIVMPNGSDSPEDVVTC